MRLINNPDFTPSGTFGNQAGGFLRFRNSEPNSKLTYDYSIGYDRLIVCYDIDWKPLYVRSNHQKGGFETGEKDASPLRCAEILYNLAVELGSLIKESNAYSPRSWQIRNEIWNGMKAPQLLDLENVKECG